MKLLRIAATTAFGLLLGTWAYLDIRLYDQPDSLYETLHGAPIYPALILLAVLTGFAVGRGWVLLSLLGPVASLAYLQETGHRGPDGVSALTSAPSIAFLIWFGLMLLIGVGIHHFWRERREQRPAEQP